MKHLDLVDLVALAAEVSEFESPKVLELLDTPEVEALLAEARDPLPPHEAAATLLVGLLAVAPLPTGGRRLALLAALHLLAVNGLDATLEPAAARAVLMGTHDVAATASWLDPLVTARDPLEGAVRESLAPDAWRAIGRAVFRAYRHGRRLATPGDLLIGMFREGTGPAAVALGADRAAVETSAPDPPPTVPTRIPAFEPEVRKVVELAFRASVVLGHHQISTGHLLLGLLDGGHVAVLPDHLSPDLVRQRVLELLADAERDEGDLASRLSQLAERLRTTDPQAAADLDEVADLQGAGLDRLVEMLRAWRGDVLLESLAREPVIARVLGPQRLGTAAAAAAEDRLLTAYLADIAQYPPLTRAEEVELAQSIRTEAAGPAWASQRRLIQSSLRLVVRIARTYETSAVSMLDLIQEGNLGLLRASETFDPTKGVRFSTYATWWIRKRIVEAIARGDSG